MQFNSNSNYKMISRKNQINNSSSKHFCLKKKTYNNIRNNNYHNSLNNNKKIKIFNKSHSRYKVEMLWVKNYL